MARLANLSTRVRPDVKRALDDVCRKRGLKMAAVVEQALREKIEDLEDSLDLADAIRSAGEMIPYAIVRSLLPGAAVGPAGRSP